MRLVWLLVLVLLVAVAAFGQGDSATPVPLAAIKPDYPADALATFRGRERIDLFIEVDFQGKVVDVEAFGPWLTCGKDDPVAEALEKAAVEAAKRMKFTPGRRLGQTADAAFVVTLSLTGTQPEPPPEKDNGIRGGVVNGRRISLPTPKYPKKAKEYRIEGAAKLDLLISEVGTIISVRAESGNPLLLKSAAKAACEAKFTPTLLAGSPVKVAASITYNFQP